MCRSRAWGLRAALPYAQRRHETMVIEFITDQKFFDWIDNHLDDGFFVGSARNYPTFLHRASCKSATTRKRENYVGGPSGMKKCGSTDRDVLVDQFSAELNYCKHCRPLNDA